MANQIINVSGTTGAWVTTTGTSVSGISSGILSSPYVTTTIPPYNGTNVISNIPYSAIQYGISQERLLKMGAFEFDRNSYTNQIMIDNNLITIMTGEIFSNPEEIDKIKTDKFIYKKLYFIDEVPGGFGKVYRFAFKEKLENKSFKEKLDELIEDDDKMFLAQDIVQ